MEILAGGPGIGRLSPGTEQAIGEAFPAAACDGTAIVVCTVGERAAGEVATDFIVEDERVVRIVVGRLLE